MHRSNPANYTDIEAFYDLLPSVLDGMDVEYEIIDRFTDVPANSIHLNWHDHGNQKNTWYIKSGYLADYFYFDRTGYSGWSTLVHDYVCDVDSDIAKNFMASFEFDSRMPQSEHAEITNKPYVLVLGQMWADKVLQFSYFKDNLRDMVTDLYEGSEYDVVYKPHPLNRNEEGNQGNLHKLIEGSVAVYTMNSGSGFEALFHNKRVFTTGVADYHWASTELRTIKEFQESKDLLDEPVDTDRINKFLYYCFTEYFMHTTDEQSIQKKIHQVVDQAS